MQNVPEWQLTYHARIDPHRRDRSLVDIMLGGQDGIVNVLGVLLGVAAAGGSSRVILAAGMAATVADSVSMAAVAYTSARARSDLYQSERAREYRHVRNVPALERAELREIYERKGFSGDLLDRIIETITQDPDVWVAVMMGEEHALSPVDRRQALRSAVVVGLAAVIGSFLPVIPFLCAGVKTAAFASMGVAATALFAVGMYKAKTTIGRPLRAGAELAAIGIASALVGWCVGALFGVGGTP
jgi:VIT1/CCC1 family predicted Fe2+/Mn2+ transporter